MQNYYTEYGGTKFKYNALSGCIWRQLPSGTWRLINYGTTNKYIRIGVLSGGNVLAHRLAWFAVYGYMPSIVDHKNRVRNDMRLSNLREASTSDSNYNCAKRSPISGHKNVYYEPRHDKWFAKVVEPGGRQVYGSLRASAEEAAKDATRLRVSICKEFACHE